MGTFYSVQPITRFGDITTSGLFGKRYVGTYSSPTWFKTATLHGDTNTVTALNGFTSTADSYSWMWLGYFRASTTETYTFYLTSDDGSAVWVGDNAISNYTDANRITGAVAFTPGSGTIALTAGVYYPIRVIFGEGGGNDYIYLEFSTPTITKTTNGINHYFGGPAAWNRFGTL